MWEEYRKFLENQNREGTPTERVLGNSAKVNEFSQFFEKHQEDMAVHGAGALNAYVTQGEAVSQDEITAFKAGLSQLPLFFEACFQDIQKKKAERKSPPDDNTKL